jgi:segregation and condensation protein B
MPIEQDRKVRQDAMNEDDPESESIPTAEEMAEALAGMPAWQVDGAPELLETPPKSPDETRVPTVETIPPSTMSETPPPPLIRILEALLFVGGPPLTAQRAAEVVRGLGEAEFQEAIDSLSRAYRSQGRPYQIQLQGHGYLLTLKPRFSSVREKLFGGVREARLSQAAVDVLSLVAYKQPATRQEIDALRGADSGGVLRQLIRHGLVALQRLEGDSESRYVTTPRFLQLFGLNSLDDLPQTQDLQRL